MSARRPCDIDLTEYTEPAQRVPRPQVQVGQLLAFTIFSGGGDPLFLYRDSPRDRHWSQQNIGMISNGTVLGPVFAVDSTPSYVSIRIPYGDLGTGTSGLGWVNIWQVRWPKMDVWLEQRGGTAGWFAAQDDGKGWLFASPVEREQGGDDADAGRNRKARRLNGVHSSEGRADAEGFTTASAPAAAAPRFHVAGMGQHSDTQVLPDDGIQRRWVQIETRWREGASAEELRELMATSFPAGSLAPWTPRMWRCLGLRYVPDGPSCLGGGDEWWRQLAETRFSMELQSIRRDMGAGRPMTATDAWVLTCARMCGWTIRGL